MLLRAAAGCCAHERALPQFDCIAGIRISAPTFRDRVLLHKGLSVELEKLSNRLWRDQRGAALIEYGY